MLFIVKSTHDYSTCQAHHPTKAICLKIHWQIWVITVSKFTVTIQIVLNTPTSSSVRPILSSNWMRPFDPILEMGNFEVTPVMKRG